MATVVSTTLDTLMTDLEGLWQRFDQLFDSMGPADWSRKHGKHWTFADVPYHLGYFDQEIVATPIERGRNVPPEGQRPMRTVAEMNAWNEARFAQRPADQTPQQSLEQMRTSRQAIRRAVAQLSDADLKRPAWCPLPFMGWLTVGSALEGCYGHTWNHFLQLRLWMKRDTPALTPSQIHRGLAFYMSIFAGFADREQAKKVNFTGVMDITGPGGAAWAIQVAHGTCCVSEERPAHADLVMTQSPETFVKTLAEMHNPMVAMLTGKIKVRGFRNLGTFGKLFHPPALDQPLDYNAIPVETLK
jgi:hypothetical protein